MAANPSRQAGSSSRGNSSKGPALVPMGHHAGKPGVPLARPVTVIGSRSTARIHLISSTVSKAHALLVKSSGGMYIRDLASRSHVYVNGEQVREADLSDGDLIKIGSFTFKFLAGPVREPDPNPAPPAQLEVTGGDFPIPVDQRVLLIGRRSSDDIVLLEESASTAHAVIFEMDGEHYVRDLGSRTGTFVNGVSTHQHKLAPGDVIRVGETDIRYQAAAVSEAMPLAGESAAGYALEAPQDEIQVATGDDAEPGEHDTIGGLDLVGEIVRDEVDHGRAPEREREADGEAEQEDRLRWRRPSREQYEPIETADDIEHEPGEAPGEVEQAQELEPLAPAVSDDAPHDDEHTSRAAESLEPLPLVDGEAQEVVARRDDSAPAPSAETEDLALELLGAEPAATASSSVAPDQADTTARASEPPAAELSPAGEITPEVPSDETPVEVVADLLPADAPAEAAADAEARVESESDEEAELQIRRGWRGTTAPTEPSDESTQAVEAVEAEEPVEVAGQQEDPSREVLRFDDSSPTLHGEHDEPPFKAGIDAGAGTAVLDGADTLVSADEQLTEAPAGEDLDFRDALAPVEPAPVGEDPVPAVDEPIDAAPEPPEIKLDFSEPEAEVEPPPIPVGGGDRGTGSGAPADSLDLNLELKDEPPAEAALAPVSDEPAPALDFTVTELPEAAPPPLIDLEKVPPPAAPLFQLSDDAAALMSATEALTRRQRDRRERQKQQNPELSFEEPAAAQEPIEPFAFEEPQIDIPPLEHIDAPVEPIEPVAPKDSAPDQAHGDAPGEPTVEVLDLTQPTPESALDLDQATEDIALGESAIADALAGEQRAPADAEAMNDTRFKRAVESMSGEAGGEIVEPPESSRTAGASTDKTAVAREQPAPGPSSRPASRPGDPFQVGANQENFLGGVPLPRKPAVAPPPQTKPVSLRSDPVDELIAEIDSAAAAAERARTPEDDRARGAAAGDVTAAPFLPVPPAVPSMPRRPRPIVKRGVELSPLPPRIDESIPPYKGGDATAGQVTTAFDGLAMPPVRQADVFSQMSPPEAAPAARDTDAAEPDPPTGTEVDDSLQASGVMTPMDLAGIKREPPAASPGAAGKRRPRSVPGTFKIPGASFFGGGGKIKKTSPESPAPGSSGAPHSSVPIDSADAVTAVAAPSPALSPGALLDPEQQQLASKSPVAAAMLVNERVASDDVFAAPRRVRPAIPDADAARAQRRPPVLYADEDFELDPAAQRRKYSRRIGWLVALMILLVPAVIVGTYMYVPVRSLVEASITYVNLAELTKRDRDQVQADQLRRLNSDYLRQSAMKHVLQTPQVSPGFLNDTVNYARAISRAGWRESGNVWTLLIPYEGTQREHDRIRMKALATALYEDNRATLIKHHSDVNSQVERLEQAIASNQKRIKELQGEIASQRILYDSRPADQQIRLLEGELTRKEEAWKSAVAAVKEAEAELARLMQGGGGKSATSPGQAPDFENDDVLTGMQRELGELQSKADENRNVSAELAREAREQLDAAMEAFKQEIAGANASVPGSPEMTAYIESARKLQETTREVIEDMARRQEQQFNSLMELKARLNEKMEARRSEQWQNDPELQDLTQRLAIATRQYNAAVGGGYEKEAAESKAEVDLIRSMIKARQELIPADPGYAEAIQQIEVFIDTTKKNIAEDRKRTDDLLARLQKSFTSGPQIASLPADQQELARRLEERLSAINAARQQYNQSLDAGAERSTDAALQQQIATIQAGIDARKKQLADEAGAKPPPEVVQQKQAEVDTLRAVQTKAEEEWFAARNELETARRAVADSRASGEKLEKLEAERNTLQMTLKTQNDTLVDKRRELKEAVYPEQPTDANVRVTDGIDRRMTWAGLAGGATLLLFAGLIGLTFMQAARIGPVAALSPSDLRPIQHPHPQPTAPNGNGAADAPDHDDDDNHEPAAV